MRSHDGAVLPIEAKGLCYKSGGRQLIGPLDMTIAQAGITALMGPNGAGKSLLLRLLHGLIKPTAGGISFCGRPAGEGAPRQALVFQKPVLLRRSVAANIAFALSLAGGTGDVDGILAEAGLTAQARQPARLLSGGEQQRLALARAMALRPQLLFLDEPTASLDPRATLLMEEMIAGIASRGIKIVLVTHDVGQARRLAADIAFMHQGRVLEHGPAGELIDEARSKEAQAFFAHRLVL